MDKKNEDEGIEQLEDAMNTASHEDWARTTLATLIDRLEKRAACVLEWSAEICWLDLWGCE
jgi:predicted transcriptional regulator